MRAWRWAVVAVALAGLVPAARADDAPAPLRVLADRHGYAFDRPEILLRQRLFGLAHGVSLLAGSCLDVPAAAAAVEAAYAGWHRGQLEVIDDVVARLAEHFFGPRAGEAEWGDLVRALRLKDNIEEALGTVPLAEACATLPQALASPRYDLTRILAEESLPE